jgi:hypothetical protein
MVTPPRILMDSLMQPRSPTLVPSSCTATAPAYDLQAALVDANTGEPITARWFVDYDQQNSARCPPAKPEDVITGPGDQAADPTRRTVPPYHFAPYDHDPVLGGPDPAAPGVIHVVELVVSNQFDAASDLVSLCTPAIPTTTFPFRTPASQDGVHFETQVYRWVFVNVPASASVPCP